MGAVQCSFQPIGWGGCGGQSAQRLGLGTALLGPRALCTAMDLLEGVAGFGLSVFPSNNFFLHAGLGGADHSLDGILQMWIGGGGGLGCPPSPRWVGGGGGGFKHLREVGGPLALPPRPCPHFGTAPPAGMVTVGASTGHFASLRAGGCGIKALIKAE